MKGVRKILTFLFLIMAVLMIVGLALPGEWGTERSVRIEANPDTVFALVEDLEQWRDWYVAFEHDPAMNATYSNPSHGMGAYFDWSGNTMVGQGRLAFEHVTPPSRLHSAAIWMMGHSSLPGKSCWQQRAMGPG